MPKLPGVNHLRAVKALEKAGFRIDRQGKHIFMSSTGEPHSSLVTGGFG
jgi:predicted RNA binding protein YcfA (HicA-like mRNA interferase family)